MVSDTFDDQSSNQSDNEQFSNEIYYDFIKLVKYWYIFVKKYLFILKILIFFDKFFFTFTYIFLNNNDNDKGFNLVIWL